MAGPQRGTGWRARKTRKSRCSVRRLRLTSTHCHNALRIALTPNRRSALLTTIARPSRAVVLSRMRLNTRLHRRNQTSRRSCLALSEMRFQRPNAQGRALPAQCSRPCLNCSVALPLVREEINKRANPFLSVLSAWLRVASSASRREASRLRQYRRQRQRHVRASLPANALS